MIYFTNRHAVVFFLQFLQISLETKGKAITFLVLRYGEKCRESLEIIMTAAHCLKEEASNWVNKYSNVNMKVFCFLLLLFYRDYIFVDKSPRREPHPVLEAA